MECVWLPAWQREAGDVPEIGLPFLIPTDRASHAPQPSLLPSLFFFPSELEIQGQETKVMLNYISCPKH